MTRCRAAIAAAEQKVFEVGPARNALILAMAHVKDAQRHVRTYTRITGKALCVLVAVQLASCTVTTPVSGCGPIGRKEGRSACVQVLGFTLRDAGDVRSAARAGGIDTVRTVDVQRVDLLGVYRKSTTIVTGE